MATPPLDPQLLLSAIIEFSDDAIVSKDVHGIVTSWNGAAERMFGYTSAEMVGKSIRLIALVSASGALFGSPRGSDVLLATLRVARDLIEADGYASWRLDPSTHVWSIGAHTGVSDEFAHQIIATYHGREVTSLPFRDP